MLHLLGRGMGRVFGAYLGAVEFILGRDDIFDGRTVPRLLNGQGIDKNGFIRDGCGGPFKLSQEAMP